MTSCSGPHPYGGIAAWPQTAASRSRLWAGVLSAESGGPRSSLIPSPDLLVAPPTPEAPDGCRFGDPRWVFPRAWVAGPRLCLRVIDFDVRVAGGSLLDHEHDELMTSARTFLLALWTCPRSRHPSISTVYNRWCFLRRALRHLVENGYPIGVRFFRDMRLEDLETMSRALSADWSSGSDTANMWAKVLADLHHYGERGLIGDWPSRVPLHLPVLLHWRNSPVEAARAERAALDASGPRPSPVRWSDETAHRAHQPLCFDTATRLAWIARYYVRVLGPCLLPLMEGFADLDRDVRARGVPATGKFGGRPGRKRCRRQFEDLFRAHADQGRWTYPDGRPIGTLPFPTDYHFPPRGQRDLQLMLGAMVGSVVVILALATGMRHSELLSLNSGSVSQAPSDAPESGDAIGRLTLSGRAYKMVAQVGGEEATWPIPDLAGDAVAIQVALFQKFTPESSPSQPTALFRSTAFAQMGTAELGDLNHHLVRFAEGHGVEVIDPTGVEYSICVSRFRPTIGAAVALAVKGAPRILQRLFRHRSIEHTFAYIHASPILRSEAARAREAALKGSSASPSLADDAVAASSTPTSDLLDDRPLHEIVLDSLRQGADVRLLGPSAVCAGAGEEACGFDGRTCASCGRDVTGHGSAAREDARAVVELLCDEAPKRRYREEPRLWSWLLRELRAHARAFPDLEAELRKEARVRVLLKVAS